MELSRVAIGVLSTVLASGVLALLRWLWHRHRPQGTLVASHEPPSSTGWDATTTVQWRGRGAAWNVLALPYNQTTAMTRGQIEAHMLQESGGQLKFQVRYPAQVAVLSTAGWRGKQPRGHLLDTAQGHMRPMTNKEVRAFLRR